MSAPCAKAVLSADSLVRAPSAAGAFAESPAPHPASDAMRKNADKNRAAAGKRFFEWFCAVIFDYPPVRIFKVIPPWDYLSIFSRKNQVRRLKKKV
jgi:hypothetical protein